MTECNVGHGSEGGVCVWQAGRQAGRGCLVAVVVEQQLQAPPLGMSWLNVMLSLPVAGFSSPQGGPWVPPLVLCLSCGTTLHEAHMVGECGSRCMEEAILSLGHVTQRKDGQVLVQVWEGRHNFQQVTLSLLF